MAKTKKTRTNVFGDSSLALVKGDFRRVYVRLPLSDVIRYREEARARGVTLDEYLVSLLNEPDANTRPRRAARPKKKQPKR